jgi:hypothetical protein
MHDDPRVHMAPDNMSAMAMREPTHEVLYQAARRLRDRAAAIEKLADELKRRMFEPDADGVLWELALGLRSSRN